MNRQRKVLITITYNEMEIIIDTKAEELDSSAQPNLQLTCNQLATDCISRQAAIDAVDSETVSTNPEHFKSSEEFIKFMDDADIASFGKWQWANGFNTALVATTIQLKKLPSAQPDGEYISRQSVTESDLIDWYINSVDESEPVWTEEHIHELFNDFYLIPKED